MICKKVFFLLFLMMAFVSARSQSISGIVLEAGTDKPVSNAGIYFDGTLNGTSTDKTGSFTLHPQANSKIPLVINAIGYTTETITDYPSGKKLIIYLKAKAYDLDAVTITASDGMSRQEKLRIFRREFLGTSAAAKSCEILNENDIRFTYNKKTNTVKAFCDNPVIVRNKNLGYTFNFILQDFTSSFQGTSFYGPQFFKEDLTETNAGVMKAREKTYLGSKMHFIRSLWNNDLEGNNFKIFRRKEGDLNYDSIVVNYDGEKYIRLKGTVIILYKNRQSFVLADSGITDVYIDKDGYNDPIGISWGGDLGEQRAADMLPLEYNSSKSPASVRPPPMDPGINSIIASADTLRSRMPAEKLYVQFDKPYYSVGDTVWLKAYLFDAAFLSPSKSGLVYFELANDTNKVLLRRMMPVVSGLGRGNIVLDKEEVPEGSYTLRAYTNLMRNFGEAPVFKKSFYVSGSSAGSWLVNSNVVLSRQSGKDNVRLALQFNRLDKQSLGLHELAVRVLDGKRVLQRDKVQTDVHGGMDINFDLAEKADPRNISLVVGDLVKGQEDHHLTIPIPVNRPENTDLQFMPEGGSLVSGISSMVGFKAISEDGHGTEISGRVYSSKDEEAASFSSSHKGMGVFELTPAAGESYTAKVVLADGMQKSYPLPAVKSSGTMLRVSNPKDSDSLEVRFVISPGVSGTYYLIGQSRGIICYGAAIRAIDVKKISKDLFPSGIARFSLLSADHEPLNERITYIDHHDNLNITMSPARASFGTRDSVSLDILVRDKDDQPVQGSFSLAVTDDGQIRTDTLGSNILTSLLLTSDLKGTVEEPVYYLQDTEKAWNDLDNLLLTQGWAGYSWKDVFNPQVPIFDAEPEFAVHGQVTNVFNKPVPSVQVQMFSTKPGFAMTSLTESNGSFNFSGFPVADSLTLFLQTKNKRNKSFNVGIKVDDFKPPVFKTTGGRFMPWYLNSDTSLLKYVNTVVQQRQEELTLEKGTNLLAEVTITAKKIIKYSRNLNGPGESDIAVEEKEVLKAGKVTLGDLLLKRIPGLRIKDQSVGGGYYVIQGLITHLIVDGIDVEFSEKAKRTVPPAEDLKEYFKNMDAEEIKGIEVMTSPRYQYRYANAYLPVEVQGTPAGIPVRHAWIEVTTRGGKGPFTHKGTGIYVHRPMPFTGFKQFYSPKYAVMQPASLTDLRSTIFWEPDIITDETGKATISFYSSDRRGTYSVIMEGTDMNGNIGRQTGQISIK